MISHDAGPVKWLRFIGGLSLIGGLLAAIALWANASEPVPVEDVFGDLTVEDEVNPFVVVMGFFALLQGLLAWAVLSVFASMAQNIELIALHTGRKTKE